MIEKKVSESQRKATKNYQSKNPERTRYLSRKSAAKHFILKLVTDEDINLVDSWIEERKTKGLQK